MFSSMRANTRFLMDNSEICDHFEDESMIARKNRNSLLGGSIEPQTSALSYSRNLGSAWTVLDIDGQIISFP